MAELEPANAGACLDGDVFLVVIDEAADALGPSPELRDAFDRLVRLSRDPSVHLDPMEGAS